MNRLNLAVVALLATAFGMPLAPEAHAEVPVTYEVVSADIGFANVEFFDGRMRQALLKVPLPWRMTVPLNNPASVGTDVAEIRADWRWAAAPNRWVTVRVYFGNIIRCANTLDVGNASCYGTTGFDNT